jgi:hypothetical protein
MLELADRAAGCAGLADAREINQNRRWWVVFWVRCK